MLTTSSNDFKELPLPQQKAGLMEIMDGIRVTWDKTVEIRFRERSLGT